MASNYKLTYNVDLVFCIDATASMSPIINVVKRNALNFYSDVINKMDAKGKRINTMRIRVVAFRDYLADDVPIMATRFFAMPAETEQLRGAINSISAVGGGDEPEDGLEALGFAMRSDWNKEGVKRRQIIVVWSDASTHPLGFGRKSPNYPQQMARNFAELTAWWGSAQSPGYVDYNSKRLLIFAPDEEGWKTISNNWDNVLHFPSEAGKGLNEVTYNQILDVIAGSI